MPAAQPAPVTHLGHTTRLPRREPSSLFLSCRNWSKSVRIWMILRNPNVYRVRQLLSEWAREPSAPLSFPLSPIMTAGPFVQGRTTVAHTIPHRVPQTPPSLSQALWGLDL